MTEVQRDDLVLTVEFSSNSSESLSVSEDLKASGETVLAVLAILDDGGVLVGACSFQFSLNS